MEENDFDYREYCVPYVFSAWCDSRNIQRTQRRVPGGRFMNYFFGLRGPDKKTKEKYRKNFLRTILFVKCELIF